MESVSRSNRAHPQGLASGVTGWAQLMISVVDMPRTCSVSLGQNSFLEPTNEWVRQKERSGNLFGFAGPGPVP
jgi:hypothetical protein